ncbi:MAG: type II toxin-antitoxin system RelE/ParE family toxin [Treponema sp.]|nr:type II toxin-antitoxin system RelE/ParE family toxin [Treponema sp.]
MFEIIIAEHAKQDIRNNLTYIKNTLCNQKAASDLADMLEKEIGSLSQFPFSGTPVPDQFLADYGFRFLLIKNYKVYYISDKDKKLVHIVRFLHGSRDYENIIREEI